MQPIGDYVTHGKAVANILCRPGICGIDMILILFEGGQKVTYGVDNDTAELCRKRSPANHVGLIALRTLFPDLPPFEGTYLSWTWEMVNQQGYFDALQLALTNHCTIQFVTSASSIRICVVTDFGDGIPPAISERSGRQ